MFGADPFFKSYAFCILFTSIVKVFCQKTTARLSLFECAFLQLQVINMYTIGNRR